MLVGLVLTVRVVGCQRIGSEAQTKDGGFQMSLHRAGRVCTLYTGLTAHLPLSHADGLTFTFTD